ncbi:tRNA (adenosine(37)-N6)-threonylcarbamoyltransferase complex ATPase subunit type 1 TsaE [Roseimaritima ulvae]|uniref:tRNA threonylcarbamoyladenosine biosynthesis protein TsaE n=1 Tax=Roseimaritima ulvae TaxID=980254 RepID=A0A5B9R6D2_9BACT|nr:tRNA (adenosine(37)-N6)-threonylcarbamoyltransferase complex ATPase subunit type 1 TsaE [Roseimaritima ulvae]QEG42091.1 tRNA threonylcarbamoyladenosine biosynthesis protein TsaE [Roseimaritima ulvae]
MNESLNNNPNTLLHPQHEVLGEIELHTISDTERLAGALHGGLPEQASIGLVGTLGVGKTRLVQAFAEQLGLDAADVTSPTFTMLQQYTGERQLYHLDAYRIVDEDEFWELGVEELFEEPAVVMIEWADRFASCMPAEMLWLRMRLQEDGVRRVEISGLAPRWKTMVAELAKPNAS